MKRVLLWSGSLLLLLGFFLVLAAGGWLGAHEGPGEVTTSPIPPAVVEKRAQQQLAGARAVEAPTDKQILFGDLHVHTTISADAFFFSMPMLQGEGSHPQADACDFARYCSALDFWSINDHAESITPQRWRETVESIRQCNAVAGDEKNPDVVAFLGWEWTQVGTTPEDHYGHKNVVLAHTDEDRIPTRPIASGGNLGGATGALPLLSRVGLLAVETNSRGLDFARYQAELAGTPVCPVGVPVRDLPGDCIEHAPTPVELFAKLEDWGLESLVIPHGTSWGFYSPPGSSWDKQLVGPYHDPKRQTLIEVYSGHGNSEEYRSWRAVDKQGVQRVCPSPSKDYLPACWHAGEIIRARCLAEGETDEECEARAVQTRALHLAAQASGYLVVPSTEPEDWLDSGQCRDCFLPAFSHRPMNSAQYILALGNFDESREEPRRFQFGFIASSDNHTARPGTGYKEYDRREMTEAAGVGEDAPALLDDSRASASRPEPFDTARWQSFTRLEAERQTSFLTTGGLVAVHADGRDRGSVWNALDRREVYGTSGPRILLWFDLTNPPDGSSRPLAMGGQVEMNEAPVFEVRAVGSLVQKPGCPEYTHTALSPERIHHLCRGECYNPSDERRLITRIEVVRIRPQVHPGEPMETLIEDPWRTLSCPADPSGCRVTFTDPEFAAAGRDALYYVRAIEEPSPAVNGANLRCERDADGACIESNPCHGSPIGTEYQDDCLAEIEPRAWSSPIFVESALP